MTIQKNMAVGALAGGGVEVDLVLHTTAAPTWLEWQPYVDRTRARCEAARWQLEGLGTLVITDGGAPSTEQRTATTNLIAQGQSAPAVAMVTESLALRTLMRGLLAFNPKMRVFAPSEFAEALEFAGLRRARAREALEALEALERKELGAGRLKTIAAIRAALR